MSTNPQHSIICVLNFLERHSDLTEEEFYAKWAVKHGILGYAQLRTPPEQRITYAQAAPLPYGTALDYDGVVEWQVSAASLPAFVKAFQDLYYIHIIEPDERTWLCRERL